MTDQCTCGKHIGIGAEGRHVGGWTDPDCVIHKGERPPWMKLDDWMDVPCSGCGGLFTGPHICSGKKQ